MACFQAVSAFSFASLPVKQMSVKTLAMSDDISLLQSLREGTKAAHEALHHHPLLAPLITPAVTLDDYRYALLAFDTFYTAIEKDVALPAFSAPVREWLAKDMAAQSLKPVALSSLALPVIDTPSRVWGYLYVKQGSTLGGSVMTKTLSRVLGLQPHETQHFFAGYGEKNGEEWKKFIENLYEVTPQLNSQNTVDMAVACFEGVAKTCDAIQDLKDRNALQAAPATERKTT